MPRVSAIVLSRNEQFMNKTICDLLDKATGDVEVIAMLEGYWPDEILRGPEGKPIPNLIYHHSGTPKGLRGAMNAGVAIASGEFVMKVDAHCMFGPGYDTILADNCEPNWVAVPTRYRLEPESWTRYGPPEDKRPPINYLRLDPSNDGINVVLWKKKNRDRSLDAIEIDDILTMQGSCFFIPRAYYYELELLDIENYGSFRKDPQEVAFKAWCSGGRVVRNKLTWYAHLHKGRRYGRGYKPNRANWKKGDEYVKRWYIDAAWNEKQTKPFRWLMGKFGDMPGWAERLKGESMALDPDAIRAAIAEEEARAAMAEKKPRRIAARYALAPRPIASKRLPRTYQILRVDGEPFTHPHGRKTASRFWNEGKWGTFIEPLLPSPITSDMTFVEMGTNAGLFLKMAADAGFGRVIGFEKNKTPARVGNEWRKALGYDYTLLKRTLGGKLGQEGTFNWDEVPIADVTLLSTFHYYVDINAWIKYVDRLAAKSCFVVVVSRPHLKEDHWMAKASLDAVRGYFRGWEEVGLIQDVSKEGDSYGRDLYSVAFQSPVLRRIPVEFIQRGRPSRPMQVAMVDLAQKIASGEEFDLTATDYYKRWVDRKRRRQVLEGEEYGKNEESAWSQRTLNFFTGLKRDTLTSVYQDGLKDALIVQREGLKLSDGGHRLALLADALGHKTVIVREV
jgi:glycosyltransferase involved in cell wall biosynthesis